MNIHCFGKAKMSFLRARECTLSITAGISWKVNPRNVNLGQMTSGRKRTSISIQIRETYLKCWKSKHFFCRKMPPGERFIFMCYIIIIIDCQYWCVSRILMLSLVVAVEQVRVCLDSAKSEKWIMKRKTDFSDKNLHYFWYPSLYFFILF